MFSSNPLDNLRWKYRVVLVSGPASKVEEQISMLKTSVEDLDDRELLVFDLNEKMQSSPAGDISSNEIRTYFDLDDDFHILLIGKDGGVKINSTQLLKPTDLFATIDRMPMRRAEMKERN